MKAHLGLDETDIELESVYRIRSNTNPKPVLVKCSNMKTKEQLVKAFREKRKQGVVVPFRIGEDFPERISKARRDLYPFFKECLENRKKVYFKNEFLFVNDQKYAFDNEKKVPVIVNK